MGEIWQYHRGAWESLHDPLPETGEEDWEKVLAGWGYMKDGEVWGDPDGTGLQIYTRSLNTDATPRWEFLVDVVPGECASYAVLVTDLPSLLGFLREYGQTFQVSLMAAATQEIRKLAETAFRVWHGHFLLEGTSCPTCELRWAPSRRGRTRDGG